MLEEVDIRMSESKRDTRDFKKDVVVGGENPRTGRTSTEKFTKLAPLILSRYIDICVYRCVWNGLAPIVQQVLGSATGLWRIA